MKYLACKKNHIAFHKQYAIFYYMAYLPTISNDRGLARYLAEISQFPILSEDEEYSLAKDMILGNLSAAQSLVQSHLRLVVVLAKKFSGYGLPLPELIAEGNIGLMKAVKKFDPELGFRLSTYAMWWVKAAMQDFILRSWSLVKIGTTAAQKKLFFNLKKIRRQINQVHGMHLDDKEAGDIAKMLGVEQKDVLEMNQRLSQQDSSLDFRHDDGDSIIDNLADETAGHDIILANCVETSDRAMLAAQAMKQLGERERDILIKRKLSEPAITLDELATYYNISRERVRQIENRAIEKIKEMIA